MEISELLKGKELDTRTTCTLTEEGHKALTCLMKEFGITQKKIFAAVFNQKSAVETVLTLAKQTTDNFNGREFRKSLVIGKKDLVFLNRICKENEISRDRMIDSIMRFLAAVLENDQESRFKKHRKVLVRFTQLSQELVDVEKEISGYLLQDDPILERYGKVVVVLGNLISAIEEEIATGAVIDPDGI
ncbi:hypothetical protein [Geomonas azotofigens]|uniref:hypothetical protein n=1 Tax=Geomonas azotofigens TaxID=2843196 RepID=UPI001C0FA3F1|nr:hypothetical protein [Geomonas azotofigens]MBU5612646.1 hypothetical protein [Geomonas azotofigens]